MNWCGQWFEYFPNPPLNVLAMVENCLAHHDASLLEHFIKYNIASHVSCWRERGGKGEREGEGEKVGEREREGENLPYIGGN